LHYYLGYYLDRLPRIQNKVMVGIDSHITNKCIEWIKNTSHRILTKTILSVKIKEDGENRSPFLLGGGSVS